MVQKNVTEIVNEEVQSKDLDQESELFYQSESEEDNEDDDYEFDSLKYSKDDLKLQVDSEFLRKEYISVLFNVNKDPLTPKDGCDFRETSETFRQEDFCKNLHLKYSTLGKFKDLIEGPDSKFEEIATNIYKKRTQTGNGSGVEPHSYIVFNAALWAEGSTDPFDSSWLRKQAFVIDFSKEYLIDGLRALLMTMKQSEWCEGVITNPALAYGIRGCPPRIPANTPIFCVIELQKIISSDKLSILNLNDRTGRLTIGFEDLYNAANEARQRGNYYFTREFYRVALDRYKSATRILLGFKYQNEEDDKRSKELLLKLYNNSAKCFNALGKPRLALSICRVAEEIDRRDSKLNWNYAKAWEIKGHLDRALARCRYAMSVAESDDIIKTFRTQAETLKKKMMCEKKELDDLYRIMGKSLSVNDK